MPELLNYDLLQSCVVCQNHTFTQLTDAPEVNYFQCQHCQVIFLNPQPRLTTLKNQYTRPGILQDGPANAWFHHNKFYLNKLYEDRLNDILEYAQTGTILDVGCGMGDFCVVAQEAGFTVCGTELSDDYADHTKNMRGITDVFIGRIQDLHFSGKKFDVISLWHVFEHLPDPCDVLNTMKGMLKKGGIVAIEVPNVENQRKRPMYLSDIKNYPVSQLEHLFYYSGASLSMVCEQMGFSLLKHKYVDCHQPSKNWAKHLMRTLRAPCKRLQYYGRENVGYAAIRLYLSH